MSIDTEKRIRFRELWHETGLDLPELATALGRSIGTITKYSHSGPSSRTPPDHILDAMDRLVIKLLIERAEALAAARGYSLARFELAPLTQVDRYRPGEEPKQMPMMAFVSGGLRFEGEFKPVDGRSS